MSLDGGRAVSRCACRSWTCPIQFTWRSGEIPGQEDVGTLLAWWWSPNETDSWRDDGQTIKWWSPENIKTIKSSSVIVFGVLLLWIIRWVKYPGHSHQVQGVQEELIFFFLFFATWDLFYFMGSPLNLFPKDYFDHLLSWMNGWWPGGDQDQHEQYYQGWWSLLFFVCAWVYPLHYLTFPFNWPQSSSFNGESSTYS